MAETENPTETVETTPNETFESWFESQPDNVKTLINNHTSGLKSALKAERDNAKSLNSQLKELQGKADKGSELEQQLNSLQAKLTESERHANFIDGATGAGCTNAKACYKLAKADPDLWKRDGSPDWDAIKETAPEFFQKKQSSGNAGSGTSQDPKAGAKQHPMDVMMRQQIGLM